MPNLKDESPLVRKNTALSLMKLEDPSAIEALERRCEAEADDAVRPILALRLTNLNSGFEREAPFFLTYCHDVVFASSHCMRNHGRTAEGLTSRFC